MCWIYLSGLLNNVTLSILTEVSSSCLMNSIFFHRYDIILSNVTWIHLIYTNNMNLLKVRCCFPFYLLEKQDKFPLKWLCGYFVCWPLPICPWYSAPDWLKTNHSKGDSDLLKGATQEKFCLFNSEAPPLSIEQVHLVPSDHTQICLTIFERIIPTKDNEKNAFTLLFWYVDVKAILVDSKTLYTYTSDKLVGYNFDGCF